jgi:hypothetical protein
VQQVEVWPTDTISAAHLPAGVTIGVELLEPVTTEEDISGAALVASTALVPGGYPVLGRERNTQVEFRTQHYDMGRPTLLQSRLAADIWLWNLANAEEVLPVPYIPISVSAAGPVEWWKEQGNAAAMGLSFVAPRTQILN